MMSLSGCGCFKQPLIVDELTNQTIWETVVYHWMEQVGDSPALLSQLIRYEAGWNQLGIQLDWFRVFVSPGIRLMGVQFFLPFGESLTFFQTYERETALTRGTWYEVSSFLYQTYRPAYDLTTPYVPSLKGLLEEN